MKRNPQLIKIFGFIASNPFYGKSEFSIFDYKTPEYNAYVAIRDDLYISGKPVYTMDYDEFHELLANNDIYVHGGFTFSGRRIDVGGFRNVEFIGDYPERLEARNKKYRVFGWDYLHYNDTLDRYPKDVIRAECLIAVDHIKDILSEVP